MCTCSETVIEEVRKVKGVIEYTGRVYRLDPVPAQHSCDYVAKRNALVDLAWLMSGKIARGEDEHALLFHREMERLVQELYEVGRI